MSHSIKHLTTHLEAFNRDREPTAESFTWTYSTPQRVGSEVIPMDTHIATSAALCSCFTNEHMETVRQKEVRNRSNLTCSIYKMWFHKLCLIVSLTCDSSVQTHIFSA